MRFGRLTVIDAAPSTRKHPKVWVRCDCGTEKAVYQQSLRCGDTRSCGCLHDEVSGIRIASINRTHGMARTRTYRIWRAMKNRTTNPRQINYERYGGRGIRVCDRWQVFENFLADMGVCPDGLTIEREDNDKGYEPGNCRRATYTEQNRNKRKAA